MDALASLLEETQNIGQDRAGFPARESSYFRRLPRMLTKKSQWLIAGFVIAYGGGTASAFDRTSLCRS